MEKQRQSKMSSSRPELPQGSGLEAFISNSALKVGAGAQPDQSEAQRAAAGSLTDHEDLELTKRSAKGKSMPRPGRPSSQEESKLKAYNLPISLIEAVQKLAEKEEGGNASRLARKVLQAYVNRKKQVVAEA